MGKQLASDKPAKLQGRKRRRTNVNDVYDNTEAKLSVFERADRLLSSLRNEVPYFVKCMLPSNVSYSYWMIFPVAFCKLFLPHCDSTVTLVDEFGEEYKTTYLFGRNGLSAGWRGFSIAHQLLKGDILIFRLIGQCKFKVHIVRVYQTLLMDAADGLVIFSGSLITNQGLEKNAKRREVCEGW